MDAGGVDTRHAAQARATNPRRVTPRPKRRPMCCISSVPAGDRYSITDLPAGEGEPNIADWSGDGSHALLTPEYGTKGAAISIDLHTGTRITIPNKGTLKYTLPTGNALRRRPATTATSPAR